jgi:UDP-3-O-[3-hydroxymyristoyl] glucosamine N-acyltransferase
MPFSAAQIAELVEGKVLGDASVVLTGFAPAGSARAGDLTFAENAAYFARAEQSAASAILVSDGFASSKKVLICVANARVAFAKILPLFFPEPVFPAGVHPTAIVPGSAQIDATAYIGPYCVLGERVRIGARSVLQGGIHVGTECQLGDDVNIFPNVTLYPRSQIGQRVHIHAGCVIGADGFGYVFDSGFHRKVPQIGHIIIQDDVEIGANVTIDRGALGPTVIGKGTKIDNLVQVGHNVVIGEHGLLVAQSGIAGSSKLGNYVTVAGQGGISGHLKIGNQVTVAAQAGVMRDIPDGDKWMGSPAQPDREMKRQIVALQHLPDLLRKVRELERRLQELESAGPEEQ